MGPTNVAQFNQKSKRKDNQYNKYFNKRLNKMSPGHMDNS